MSAAAGGMSYKTVSDGVPSIGVQARYAEQRSLHMREAWDAYLGNLPDALSVEPNQPNLNVKSNRLAPIVDTGIFYLFGLPLQIEVAPTDTDEEGKPLAGAQDEAAQDFLEGCWGDEDDRMTLLSKLGQNGAVFGHAFAKILPAEDAPSGRQYPRLVVLDPQTVTVQTDPDDCESVASYTIEYDAELPTGATIRKRQIIIRRDVYEQMQALTRPATKPNLAVVGSDANSAITDADGGSGEEEEEQPIGAEAGWVILTHARSGDGGAWRPLGGPVAWPHAWSPIVDCQNLPVSNQHWGMADLTPDVIQLNRVLNFVLSNINSIGYSHGHPWPWVAGADASQITIAPGRIIGLPSPDAKLDALIAKGDIAGLMAYAADIRASMDEQSKVPGVATGRIAELPRGQMSGVSLRMLYQPLLFKTTFKRRLYGKLIREASTRMLALGGFGDGTDAQGLAVMLHWKDPMPTDDLQEAQTALAWQQIGVSKDTLMQRGGFDPDAEATKTEVETQRAMHLQNQGMMQLGAGGMMPAIAAAPASVSAASASPEDAEPEPPSAAAAPPTTRRASARKTPNTRPVPPVNHPKAVIARQAAQAAAGKPVTPNGM